MRKKNIPREISHDKISLVTTTFIFFSLHEVILSIHLDCGESGPEIVVEELLMIVQEATNAASSHVTKRFLQLENLEDNFFSQYRFTTNHLDLKRTRTA